MNGAWGGLRKNETGTMRTIGARTGKVLGSTRQPEGEELRTGRATSSPAPKTGRRRPRGVVRSGSGNSTGTVWAMQPAMGGGARRRWAVGRWGENESDSILGQHSPSFPGSVKLSLSFYHSFERPVNCFSDRS